MILQPHHPTPWESIPQERRDTAAKVLTEKQLQILRHRINHHTWRTIANTLDITEPTARGHYQAAIRKLEQHYRRKDAA
jgi:DNA-binding CsgD family transcriptional regulator